MSRNDGIALAYLATIVAFILALKFLSSPKSAPLGNRIGAAGMALAIGATFAQSGVHNDWSILIVMAVSAPIGAVAARAVKMTAMPQMVALFNGVVLGGLVAVALVVLIGPQREALVIALLCGALLLGVLFVLPIGGADMPVVISLLNAFTGLAAAATGFVLHSYVLIVSGMLVGASGTLLTLLMGRAMNRSIANVLFGAFGQIVATPGGAAAVDGAVRSTTPEDVAVMLAYAKRVVIVPGYGLAVAQAQHDVRALADALEERGVQVEYAIHPVAGRMPGHMNVLLAEAKVPYPQLKEMDEVNPEFPRTDVALVIGANDVVNPDARTNTASPIYGMPILNVDEAGQVVVLKRSMNPGFAGIDNPLFLFPNTTMLFGDAKTSVEKLIASVKAV